MERKENTPIQILISEVLAKCSEYLSQEIDTLIDGDTTISLVEGHGGGIYAQAEMIIDVVKGKRDVTNRIKGYIILADQVLNHPGDARRGETYPVDIDELNELLTKLKTFVPKQ